MGKVLRFQVLYCLTVCGNKISKGKGIIYKGDIDPYAYNDILSGYHFFNLRGMKSSCNFTAKDMGNFFKGLLDFKFFRAAAVFFIFWHIFPDKTKSKKKLDTDISGFARFFTVYFLQNLLKHQNRISHSGGPWKGCPHILKNTPPPHWNMKHPSMKWFLEKA